MAKLKVAIISAGMITNAAHLPAYKNLKDEVEVVGICDLNKEAAEATAERFSIPGVFTDAEKMLRELKPDIVSICTPTLTHVALSKLALELGANVICEKPLALSYQEALMLYQIADSKGLLLVPCQSVRFREDFLAAKRIVEDGILGDIYYAELSRVRRRGIPKWGAFHKKAVSGGGAFCDIGVHMIDSLLWIMGNPKIEAVSGRASTNIANNGENLVESLAESGAPSGIFNSQKTGKPFFEVEDCAAGSMKLENNGVLNFKVAFAMNLPNSTELTIAGTKAGISIPKMEIYSSISQYQATTVPRLFDEGRYKDKTFNGHWYLIENVVNALKGKEELVIKKDEAINVVSAIDAFYQSVKLDREVLINEL